MGVKKIKGMNRFIEKPEQAKPLPERFRVWAEEHYAYILGGGIALLLVVIGAWGVNIYADAKEGRAQTDYAQLLQKWPNQDTSDPKEWEKRIPELEKFVQEHRGTAPALDAQMDIVQANFQMQHYEDAVKWGKKILDEIPAGNSLRVLAHYQLALIYEAGGKTEEALVQWNALKSEGGMGLGREVDWHLARLHSRKGEYPRAVEEYEQALKSPGNYPSSALLQDELASLKLKTASPGESSKGSAQANSQ